MIPAPETPGGAAADGDRQLTGELAVAGLPVSWVLDSDDLTQPLVVLAHGAGAPYSHPFLVATAAGMVARGFSVLRFHFPYMEAMARGGSRRPPNGQSTLLDTWAAILGLASHLAPNAPLILAGKSMGGRMASLLLSAGRAPVARAAIYLGYPLHPPGKPEKLRAAHLAKVPVRQLFVQGSKDNLCRLDLLQPVLAGLGARAELCLVEGGDHSLARTRKDPLAGADEWLDAMASFTTRQLQ